MASKFGVRTGSISEKVVWGADLILIAVPPNIVLEIIIALSPNLNTNQVLISFSAAISLKSMKAVLPDGMAIGRVMPNAPSLIGQGCNPVAFGEMVTPKKKVLVEELLELLGETLTIRDEQMNWCVGLTGAAMRSLLPALEGMTLAGIEAGLSPTDARQVAAQVMLGTANLVQQSSLSFEQIKALTPMQTVDEEELIRIFLTAASEAQEKVNSFQKKLESNT
jgi:pyrroline-5-carboxylate reductase